MPTFYARIHHPEDRFTDGTGEALTAYQAAEAAGSLLADVTFTYPAATPPYLSLGAAISGPLQPGEEQFFAEVTASRQDFIATGGGGHVVAESISIISYSTDAPAAFIVQYTAPTEVNLSDVPDGSRLAFLGGYPDAGYAYVTFASARGAFLYVTDVRVWWDGPGGPAGPEPEPPTAFWTRLIGTSETI